MENPVLDIDHARRIARQYAEESGANEARSETYADVWFDASKDIDASTVDALRAYLRRRFTASE